MHVYLQRFGMYSMVLKCGTLLKSEVIAPEEPLSFSFGDYNFPQLIIPFEVTPIHRFEARVASKNFRNKLDEKFDLEIKFYGKDNKEVHHPISAYENLTFTLNPPIG